MNYDCGSFEDQKIFFFCSICIAELQWRIEKSSKFLQTMTIQCNIPFIHATCILTYKSKDERSIFDCVVPTFKWQSQAACKFKNDFQFFLLFKGSRITFYNFSVEHITKFDWIKTHQNAEDLFADSLLIQSCYVKWNKSKDCGIYDVTYMCNGSWYTDRWSENMNLFY